MVGVAFWAFVGVDLVGDGLFGDFLAEVVDFAGVVFLVVFPDDAFFAGVVAFTVFFGETFFACAVLFEGEVLFVTRPVCTWSAAASCAFAEGTARLGELLVVRSGLAGLAFVALVGDALVDFAGEVLRPAFAGVPSTRAFAIAEVVSRDLVYPTEREHGALKSVGARSKQWDMRNVAAQSNIGMRHASRPGFTTNESKQMRSTNRTDSLALYHVPHVALLVFLVPKFDEVCGSFPALCDHRVKSHLNAFQRRPYQDRYEYSDTETIDCQLQMVSSGHAKGEPVLQRSKIQHGFAHLKGICERDSNCNRTRKQVGKHVARLLRANVWQ